MDKNVFSFLMAFLDELITLFKVIRNIFSY